MRTVFACVVLAFLTMTLGTFVVVLSFLGVPQREDSLYEIAAHWWCVGVSWGSGVRLVVHGGERGDSARHVFVANHMSWLDVPVLSSLVRHFRFVAKAEIARWPVFGAVFRAIGTVYIHRSNRKAAFDAYREAAGRIQGGGSVVVFPEGTRGTSYPLRPFKKGPFVLAISAQAPIVPTVVHGTFEILPKKGLWMKGGRVDVHFLEPVSTAGLTYDDREEIANTVRDRMAALLRESYGVESEVSDGRRSGD
jgi:1-acyl-sn-glycerol-3-phosphate acyltransferase